MSEFIKPDEPVFTIYSAQEFFPSFQKDVAATGSGDRIAMLTMAYNPFDDEIAETMSYVTDAADRGVEVNFGIDAHCFMYHLERNLPGPLLLPGGYALPFYRERMKKIDALNSHPNVRTTVINKPERPFASPLAGRSHIKVMLVNNKISVLGPNLDLTLRRDLAISFEDEAAADSLHDLMKAIVTDETTKVMGRTDLSIPVTKETDILIDVGTPGQSLILDEAAAIISRAQQYITMSGQFFPGDDIRAGVVAAHQQRNVDVAIAYNHPRSQGGFLKPLWQIGTLALARRNVPAELLLDGRTTLDDTTVHAAGLATEHEAEFGSTNYVRLGANLGTPELVLRTRQQTLAHAIGTSLAENGGLRLPATPDTLI